MKNNMIVSSIAAAFLAGTTVSRELRADPKPVFIVPEGSAGPNYPIFNLDDNEECRQKVIGWHDMAQKYHERDMVLEQYYRDILDSQLKYRFELVNNNKFYEWAADLDLTAVNEEPAGDDEIRPMGEIRKIDVSDMDFGYMNGDDHYDDMFEQMFGTYTGGDEIPEEITLGRPIRLMQQLDKAMYYLYQFRYFRGLEDNYHFGRRRQLLSFAMIQPDEYMMCSEAT